VTWVAGSIWIAFSTDWWSIGWLKLTVIGWFTATAPTVVTWTWPGPNQLPPLTTRTKPTSTTAAAARPTAMPGPLKMRASREGRRRVSKRS